MKQQDLIGSWQLVGAELIGADTAATPPPFGANPQGILHYLADGRMAVMIQSKQRAPSPGGRQGGSDADWRGAARSFTAYAGRYSLTANRVIHHVEMNSFPNDVGVDYPRLARMDHGRLLLETPPDLPPDQRPMRLIWARHAPAIQSGNLS